MTPTLDELTALVARAIRAKRRMSLCSLCDSPYRKAGMIGCSCWDLAVEAIAAISAHVPVREILAGEPTEAMIDALMAPVVVPGVVAEIWTDERGGLWSAPPESLTISPRKKARHALRAVLAAAKLTK